jgi:hypothetical protein
MIFGECGGVLNKDASNKILPGIVIPLIGRKRRSKSSLFSVGSPEKEIIISCGLLFFFVTRFQIISATN